MRTDMRPVTIENIVWLSGLVLSQVMSKLEECHKVAAKKSYAVFVLSRAHVDDNNKWRIMRWKSFF